MTETVITVEKISVRYLGPDSFGAEEIEFSVDEGEMFGFLGPRGAGRPTTQQVLTRLLRRYEGKTDILGRCLHEWGPEYVERVEEPGLPALRAPLARRRLGRLAAAPARLAPSCCAWRGARRSTGPTCRPNSKGGRARCWSATASWSRSSSPCSPAAPRSGKPPGTVGPDGRTAGSPPAESECQEVEPRALLTAKAEGINFWHRTLPAPEGHHDRAPDRRRRNDRL